MKAWQELVVERFVAWVRLLTPGARVWVMQRMMASDPLLGGGACTQEEMQDFIYVVEGGE